MTVDVVVLTLGENGLDVLLIQRKDAPYKGNAKAKVAARPPASATPKSMGLGRVREITSMGSSCKLIKGRRELAQVMATATKIARTAPRISPVIENFSSSVSPRIDARPKPSKGDMSGATSMAPIMVAAELINRPNVAIVAERTTSTK